MTVIMGTTVTTLSLLVITLPAIVDAAAFHKTKSTTIPHDTRVLAEEVQGVPDAAVSHGRTRREWRAFGSGTGSNEPDCARAATCPEIYSPVCIRTVGIPEDPESSERVETYSSPCRAMACGFTENDWTGGACPRLCDAGSWPGVRSHPAGPQICADCSALINFNDHDRPDHIQTCNDYCSDLGLFCEDANDEIGDSCRVKGSTADLFTCETRILDTSANADALCYCSRTPPSWNAPPSAAPTQGPTPLTTQLPQVATQDLGPGCHTEAWPAVKNGHICSNLAPCAALIDFSDPAIAGAVTNCGDYCDSQGLLCLDANDEKNNECRVQTARSITCTTVFGDALVFDGICYCSAPSTGAPSTPSTPAVTTSTPDLSCNPASWPAVKNGNVCDNLAECTALIDFSDAGAGGATNCAEFCANQNFACLGTHDEKRNNCRPRLAVETSCSTVIDSVLGMDAICYCGIATDTPVPPFDSTLSPTDAPTPSPSPAPTTTDPTQLPSPEPSDGPTPSPSQSPTTTIATFPPFTLGPQFVAAAPITGVSTGAAVGSSTTAGAVIGVAGAALAVIAIVIIVFAVVTRSAYRNAAAAYDTAIAAEDAATGEAIELQWDDEL